MSDFMTVLEHSIGAISSSIWEVFLPVLVVLAIYIGYKNLFIIKPKTTLPAKVTFKQFIGPTSISLGAMVGTGAVIGVLGALNNYAAAGQQYIEGLVFWTLIGSLIMVPLSYAETMLSKVMNKVPEDMIRILVGKKAASIYAVSFVALYVFGFGGFQFSGIGSILSLVGEQFAGVTLSTGQRYLYIVIPLVAITSLIVLTKKHDIFINAMASMIGFAVLLYCAFFIVFIYNTSEFLPIFMSNMIESIKNPVSMMMGVPMGIILSIQRITQTTESGIGGLPMAAHENDSEPRAAAMISVIPVIVTVFIAIIVTTYITSYGVYATSITLPADAFSRLSGLFNTIYNVTGNFGLIVLVIFAVLSGASTLLGSYYYVKVLFHKNTENKNIFLYILMLIAAGTLATFGFSIVFDIVDLLMFLIIGINLVALTIFVNKEWKNYIIDDKEKNKVIS